VRRATTVRPLFMVTPLAFMQARRTGEATPAQPPRCEQASSTKFAFLDPWSIQQPGSDSPDAVVAATGAMRHITQLRLSPTGLVI